MWSLNASHSARKSGGELESILHDASRMVEMKVSSSSALEVRCCVSCEDDLTAARDLYAVATGFAAEEGVDGREGVVRCEVEPTGRTVTRIAFALANSRFATAMACDFTAAASSGVSLSADASLPCSRSVLGASPDALREEVGGNSSAWLPGGLVGLGPRS